MSLPRFLAPALLFALAFSMLTPPLLAQAPPALASPLDELDWLLGDWAADAAGSQVRSTCEWDAGKRFLIRHIYVEKDGRTLHSVGQRFGYDPAAKTVKVWSFDWDGSHAEGTITQDGKNWVFATAGVANNGDQWKSTNTYSDITANGFTLTSVSSPDKGDAKTSVLKFVPYTAPAAPSLGSEEIADVSSDPAKQAIFNSKEWKEVRRSLQEWLSVQKVYTRAETASMKAQIESKIAKMDASELQDFLDETRDKVQVLLSKEGEDARSWLAQYMAVKVMSKDQWDKMRPDVVNMSAQQLKERLTQLSEENAKTAQLSQQAQQGRDLQSQAIRQEIQYQRQSHEAALNRASYGDYGSYRW